MLLCEITDNQLLVKLVALSSKIKHSLEHDEHDREPWMDSKDAFLDYLADQGVIIDSNDLMKMIADDKGPLSKVIDNIQGDTIVWKDDESNPDTEQAALDAESQEMENQAIVGDMAKKALPK